MTIVASHIDTIVETVIEKIYELPIDVEKQGVCKIPELPIEPKDPLKPAETEVETQAYWKKKLQNCRKKKSN